MHFAEGKKRLCLFTVTLALAISGCGTEEKGKDAEQPTLTVAAELTKEPNISATKEPEVTDEAKEPTPAGVFSETSEFFEFPDAAIDARLKGQEEHSFTFFCSATVDGTEFALLDCLFLTESSFHNEYLAAKEQFLGYFPELTGETKLFLRRAEKSEYWEATVLEQVSKDCYTDPYIAFNSKENGMIIFGDDYMYIYVTEDGGQTWTSAENVPDIAKSVVGSIRCLTGCGENSFLIGHRYKGTPETGQLSLTKDNGKTWTKIELPAPPTGELEYRYSEPVGFRWEDEKLFLEMNANAEEPNTETENNRQRASYDLVSADGGLTWVLSQPQEALEFYPVE